MQLNITGQHIEITPALRKFVNNKFSRLEQYSNRITQVHVVLKVERVQQIADATLHVSGSELHAAARCR